MARSAAAPAEPKPASLPAAFGAGLRRGLRVRGALTFLVHSSTVRRHVFLCTIANLCLLGVGLSRAPVVQLLDWVGGTTHATHKRTTLTGLARALLASLAKGGHLGGSLLAYVVVMALTNGWASAIARSVAAAVAARRAAAGASQPLPPPPRGGGGSSMWAAATDALLRVLIVALMTAGTVVLDAAGTVVGRPAALLLCAFLYSLSAHDAVASQLPPAAAGSQQQLPLEARLVAAERAWPYHVGFGLPAAALSFMGSWVVNGAAYGLSLPWLVLLAGAAAAAPSPPPRRVGWRVPLTWPFRAATLMIARAAAGCLSAWRWYRRRAAAAAATVAAGGSSASDSDDAGL